MTQTISTAEPFFFPGTGTFREYTLPPGSSPLHISIEPEGPLVKAWFTSLGGTVGKITYDPSPGTVRMYQLNLPAAAGGGDVDASALIHLPAISNEVRVRVLGS
jgi:streptogramin lyase